MKIYYNPKLKQRARELRKSSTLSEILLWNQLKSRQMKGYQFMRQKPIDEYIVDFFCSPLKLIIEIDGSSHDYRLDQDLKRQGVLENLGLTMLRFEDGKVKKDMKMVLEAIYSWIEESEQDKQVDKTFTYE